MATNGNPLAGLKVVVRVEEARVSVGIEKPDRDPRLFFYDSNGSDVGDLIALAIEGATALWNEQPHFPKYEKPPEPVRERPQRGRAQRGAQTPATAPAAPPAPEERIVRPRLF